MSAHSFTILGYDVEAVLHSGRDSYFELISATDEDGETVTDEVVLGRINESLANRAAEWEDRRFDEAQEKRRGQWA